MISFAPGYPAADTFPWAEFQEIARELLTGADGACCSTGRRGATGRCSRRSSASWTSRGVAHRAGTLLVTTGSQQGLDLVARVLLDPGDVVLVELPTYTGAITAFRNVRRRWSACRRKPTASISRRSTTPSRGSSARGRRVQFLYVVPNFQNPTGLLIGLREAPRRCSSGPRAATC